jgi:hypothetical protein
MVLSKANVSLLLAVGADEGVDAGNINVVHGFDGLSDLAFVGTSVNDESQSVVVFDLLHCGFRGEGVFDNGEFVKFVERRSRFAGVFGRAGKAERLGLVKVDFGVDFGRFLLDIAFADSLGGSFGFAGDNCGTKTTSKEPGHPLRKGFISSLQKR